MHISNKILVKTDPVFRFANSSLEKVTKIKDLDVIFKTTWPSQTISPVSFVNLSIVYICILNPPKQKTLHPWSWLIKHTSCLFLITVLFPYQVSTSIGDIRRIESVQRMFTKQLFTFSNLSYSERLSKACMVSLELRRAHADIILCFQIVHGFLNINLTHFFIVWT